MIKKIEILNMDELIMVINFTDIGGKAHVNNISGKKNAWLPYISRDEKEYNISISQIIQFMETRCVPRTRDGIEDLLKYKYHLKEYSPIGICRQTHGVSHNDNYWLRFDDEKLRFDDVSVR